MARRLRREERMTIQVLAEKGRNHCEIARALGVSEGTVRYDLKRQAEGATDGRAEQPFKAEALSAVIAPLAFGAGGKSSSGERPGALGAPGV